MEKYMENSHQKDNNLLENTVYYLQVQKDCLENKDG